MYSLSLTRLRVATSFHFPAFTSDDLYLPVAQYGLLRAITSFKRSTIQEKYMSFNLVLVIFLTMKFMFAKFNIMSSIKMSSIYFIWVYTIPSKMKNKTLLNHYMCFSMCIKTCFSSCNLPKNTSTKNDDLHLSLMRLEPLISESISPV